MKYSRRAEGTGSRGRRDGSSESIMQSQIDERHALRLVLRTRGPHRIPTSPKRQRVRSRGDQATHSLALSGLYPWPMPTPCVRLNRKMLSM